MRSASSKHLVFTNSFNAWSIQRGLEKLGTRLESTTATPGLVPRSNRPPQPGDTLYFTEERSLKKYYGDTTYNFYPGDKKLSIDDKLAFSEWLISIGERPVPFARDLGTSAKYPCVLKAKHSWIGEQQLTRGFICRTPADLSASLKKINRNTLKQEWFFLQKFVDGQNQFYSTSGFFDHHNPKRNAVLVTQRTLSTGTGLQSGAIVETTSDPENLVARTTSMLTQLEYEGPFELEFVHDALGNYYVLEMNPRFWLQHSMFIDFFDNVLLKRYTDRDDTTDFPNQASDYRPAIWLNTWFFLHAMLKGRIRECAAFYEKISQMRRGLVDAIWYPGWPQAISWLVKTPHRRFARSLQRISHA